MLEKPEQIKRVMESGLKVYIVGSNDLTFASTEILYRYIFQKYDLNLYRNGEKALLVINPSEMDEMLKDILSDLKIEPYTEGVLN